MKVIVETMSMDVRFAVSHTQLNRQSKHVEEVLWLDKDKMYVSGLHAKQSVSWKANTAHHLEHTIPAVKHGGDYMATLFFRRDMEHGQSI